MANCKNNIDTHKDKQENKSKTETNKESNMSTVKER
jgi:hypothetical protein